VPSLTVAEVDALIATIAAEPKSASGDGHSAENHDLESLRKLRNALLAEEALAAQPYGGSAWAMTRPARFVPRGPGGES
jgi:hypothetical protein